MSKLLELSQAMALKLKAMSENPPKAVPTQVTAKQLNLALLGAGVSLSNIDAIINQMTEPQKSYAKVSWEKATIFERNHPMINALGSALGLTMEQIDTLFVQASKL